MKSLAVSLCVLSASIIVILLNCKLVTSHLSEISVLTEELCEIPENKISTESCKIKVQKLSDLWHRYINFLSMSVNSADLRDCSVALGNISAFLSKDNFVDFRAALSDFKTRIDVLLERESFSILNII